MRHTLNAFFVLVPFHFWTVVFFVFGTMVGSFLNVCIYRMPRGESVVRPPSHCPECQYSIPWYLNIPLITWLALRGRCANCRLPISPRYIIVEFFTGLAFAGCWLALGPQDPLVAVVYCLVLAGFIAATFIDLEHLIIPDEITIGGTVVGLLCSAAVPALHHASNPARGLEASFWGMAAGAGIIYAIVRGGKLVFGRQKLKLDPGTKLIFTETGIELPGETVPFEDLFYRKSDQIVCHGKTIELPDRCYFNALVKLSPSKLSIGEETYNPEDVSRMEIVTDQIVIPREAMGLGDVKFMAAIGSFLGWPAVLFSLMASALIGSAFGITTILLRRKEWSSRIPYGPYIALAAVIWMFLPFTLQVAWKNQILIFLLLISGRLPPM